MVEAHILEELEDGEPLDMDCRKLRPRPLLLQPQESYLKPVHKIATISPATVGRQYGRNRIECKRGMKGAELIWFVRIIW